MRSMEWNYRRQGKKLLHRVIWEEHYGPIPDDKEIHHIDGNTENNVISNLECLTHKKHMENHRDSFKGTEKNCEYCSESLGMDDSTNYIINHLNEHIDDLKGEVQDLINSNDELEKEVEELNARIKLLENES